MVVLKLTHLLYYESVYVSANPNIFITFEKCVF